MPINRQSLPSKSSVSSESYRLSTKNLMWRFDEWRLIKLSLLIFLKWQLRQSTIGERSVECIESKKTVEACATEFCAHRTPWPKHICMYVWPRNNRHKDMGAEIQSSPSISLLMSNVLATIWAIWTIWASKKLLISNDQERVADQIGLH